MRLGCAEQEVIPIFISCARDYEALCLVMGMGMWYHAAWCILQTHGPTVESGLAFSWVVSECPCILFNGPFAAGLVIPDGDRFCCEMDAQSNAESPSGQGNRPRNGPSR